jgi:hypothetical protein
MSDIEQFSGLVGNIYDAALDQRLVGCPNKLWIVGYKPRNGTTTGWKSHQLVREGPA